MTGGRISDWWGEGDCSVVKRRKESGIWRMRESVEREQVGKILAGEQGNMGEVGGEWNGMRMKEECNGTKKGRRESEIFR